jgi:formate dehydrogenase subunit gamma
MTRYLQRYQDRDRMNHWIVAILFFCAALSGLAFFHPSLFFLSNLFGGGPWTRILHPFMGLLTVLCFVRMFVRLWRTNVLQANDRHWLHNAGRILRGDVGAEGDVGKYNAGQKIVFWAIACSLLVLLVTGFIFWRPWFAPYFPVTLVRLAVLLHALAAVVMVLAIIMHIYAAIWVKGTLRAMTRGTVTEAWARQNHPLWHKDMTRGE